MAIHLAANFVALANVANTDAPALNDSILTILNGHHVPRGDTFLLGAYASAVTMTNARLYTPFAIQTTPPYLYPHGTTLLPPTLPAWVDWRRNPFLLRANEEVPWQLTDSAAGPNNAYVLSWWSDGVQDAPQGPVYKFLGTSTTAAVASTWTPVTTTWTNTLPAGRYACIGGSYYATNAIAFSATFYNQYFRPGGLGFASHAAIPPSIQTMGGSGLWGYFDTLNLPKMTVLNDGTDNAHTFVLDVVRLP